MEWAWGLSASDLERRKQLVRDAWAYRKIDHIPIMMSLDYNPFGYTMQQELYNHEIQFQLRMHACERSLALLPDDYIPCAFINVGCVGISNAFGAHVYKSNHPQQTPSILKPVLHCIEDVYDLPLPNVRLTEYTRYFLDRFRYFYDRTQGSVYLSGLDTNGPLGVAMDLFGSEKLMLAMCDDPEAVLHLLGKIDTAIIDVIEATLEIAGGNINALTSTDFFYSWCPEGYKGHMSSDLCASYSPRFFREFDVPANSPVFAKYGPGLLHNCGPNPCVEEYLNHNPNISGINLAYNYSKNDLPKIKKALQGKIVYFFYEEEPWSALCNYRHTMEQLAPDVIAIPILSVHDESIDPAELYGKFREVSEEYAHRVFG